MCAPIPPGKWSWKYDRCVVCGTTSIKGKHRHKGRGLCLSCWDKKRGRKPERQAYKKKAQEKWYNKVKGTEEFKKYSRERVNYWQKNSPQYLIFRKKQRLREKFKRYIKNQQKGTNRYLKRNEGGLQFRCDGCQKNCLITSIVKPDKMTGVETEKAMRELKIFKEVYIKLCDKKICTSQQNTNYFIV